MAYESLMVFTGNANPLLAHAVVRRLNIPLGHATVGKFSDGEIMVDILENVRGKDCFVLQSTCAPANDSLMEVLLMVDALKRASAARVTAAIPYFGYARQDRRAHGREPVSTRLVADLLDLARLDAHVGPHAPRVDAHLAGTQQLLQMAMGDVGEMHPEPAVEPHARLVARHLDGLDRCAHVSR